MTDRERLANTKSLCYLLAELFQVTVTQAAIALSKRNINSWPEFQAHVALKAQAIEESEKPQ